MPTAWPNFSVSILMCFSAAGLFLHVARSACRGKVSWCGRLFRNGGNFAGRRLRLLVLHMTSMSSRGHRLKRSGWRCHTGTHVQGCPIRSIRPDQGTCPLVLHFMVFFWIWWVECVRGNGHYLPNRVVHPSSCNSRSDFWNAGNKSGARGQFHETKLTRTV